MEEKGNYSVAVMQACLDIYADSHTQYLTEASKLDGLPEGATILLGNGYHWQVLFHNKDEQKQQWTLVDDGNEIPVAHPTKSYAPASNAVPHCY